MCVPTTILLWTHNTEMWESVGTADDDDDVGKRKKTFFSFCFFPLLFRSFTWTQIVNITKYVRMVYVRTHNQWDWDHKLSKCIHKMLLVCVCVCGVRALVMCVCVCVTHTSCDARKCIPSLSLALSCKIDMNGKPQTRKKRITSR